jgi:pyruvate decarboxylase
MEAKYNDIQPWRYTLAPEFFGAKAGKTKTFTVSNIGELTSLIEDSEFQTGKGLQFVEVKMPWDSAPEPLKIIVDGAKKRNQGGN